MTTDLHLADIRTRDTAWTANYANMHKSDGYGQAAADRRSLLGEVERLRADIENLKSYTGVYSQGWRSPYARPAPDVGDQS